MTVPDDRSPEEIAAQRMLADPDAIRRRMEADIAAVEALGRGEVRLDPAAGDEAVASAVRSLADRIGFDSPIEAATMSMRHLHELPVAERGPGSAIEAYLTAASRTIAQGQLVGNRGYPEGHRWLTFHRTAREAAGITVALEASVYVDADGSVRLFHFHWPTERPQTPVYAFGGTPERYMDQALCDLRDHETPFDRAMLMLLANALGGPGTTAGHEQRAEIAELVAQRRGELSAYVTQAENYALAVRADRWYAACLYRSALETVFENFLGGAGFSLIDMQEIQDIDEELDDALPEVTDASPAAVPQGIPPHHWWWNTAVR
ncbi:hypothetical protein HNR23_004136 [Nocardiopsis mwathae]|uniref:Uncharacterized protein n=1 Tax=Nocardiopsis mwathae TaxID=1472723 RepID=A0A7W9YM39_9ACTN|nr:hypothetical protein [Nocardiopsis mwathae]MBB6174076.1 hypothetical protein [Nocardiopsis mwathae]